MTYGEGEGRRDIPNVLKKIWVTWFCSQSIVSVLGFLWKYFNFIDSSTSHSDMLLGQHKIEDFRYSKLAPLLSSGFSTIFSLITIRLGEQYFRVACEVVYMGGRYFRSQGKGFVSLPLRLAGFEIRLLVL